MTSFSAQKLVLKTILDVVGEEGMAALRVARGGMAIHIPLDPKPDHWMSRLWGYASAQEISRRLTVIDADGRPTCNLSCYISRGITRLQEVRRQILSEMDELLLSGMANRDVAITVRMTEMDVQRRRRSLVAIGKLQPLPAGGVRKPVMLPGRPLVLALPAPKQLLLEDHSKKELWEVKNAIVDEGILKGQSNRVIAMAAAVCFTHIRTRRKLLLASGKLKPGRIGLGKCAPASKSPAVMLPRPSYLSADHSAKVGEMVARDDEVP